MKIFLAMPNLGEVSIGNVNNLLAWQHDPTLDIEFYMPDGIRPGATARNKCHKAFLESDCDVLFFLDERTVPMPWFLDKLLGYVNPEMTLHPRDMVAACVQTYKAGTGGEPYLAPLGFRYNQESGGYQPEFGAALTEVHIATCACTVIRREVMATVERPAFIAKPLGEFGETVMTCDFDFSEKVRAAGYRIWMDYGILCSHYQRLNVKTANRMVRRTAKWAKGEKNDT